MTVKCSCCIDTGRVLSILGELRPCSRCNAEEFNKWSERRRLATEREAEREAAVR